MHSLAAALFCSALLAGALADDTVAPLVGATCSSLPPERQSQCCYQKAVNKEIDTSCNLDLMYNRECRLLLVAGALSCPQA